MNEVNTRKVTDGKTIANSALADNITVMVHGACDHLFVSFLDCLPSIWNRQFTVTANVQKQPGKHSKTKKSCAHFINQAHLWHDSFSVK